MGCPIFAKLPTPLVLFCPILVDPQPPLKSDIIYVRSPMPYQALQLWRLWANKLQGVGTYVLNYLLQYVGLNYLCNVQLGPSMQVQHAQFFQMFCPEVIFLRIFAQLHSVHMLQPAAWVLLFYTYWLTQLPRLQRTACLLLFCTYWLLNNTPANQNNRYRKVVCMLQAAACVHYVCSWAKILRNITSRLHSLCFISNTVNEGLVTHFQNSIVVAQCYLKYQF